jgi:hypothetical protein
LAKGKDRIVKEMTVTVAVRAMMRPSNQSDSSKRVVTIILRSAAVKVIALKAVVCPMTMGIDQIADPKALVLVGPMGLTSQQFK